LCCFIHHLIFLFYFFLFSSPFSFSYCLYSFFFYSSLFLPYCLVLYSCVSFLFFFRPCFPVYYFASAEAAAAAIKRRERENFMSQSERNEAERQMAKN
jgi:predicted membrane protein